MNISEVESLKKEIAKHNDEIRNHSFALKSKQAKLRKLEKIMQKFNEVANEQLPPAVQ
jgi:hypothetical protein